MSSWDRPNSLMDTKRRLIMSVLMSVLGLVMMNCIFPAIMAFFGAIGLAFEKHTDPSPKGILLISVYLTIVSLIGYWISYLWSSPFLFD
jgi:hypothetical protein